MTEPQERVALGPAGVMLMGALLAAATMLVVTISLAIMASDSGWDARYAYLGAADAILAGRSPYPDADQPLLDADKAYVYPPQVAIAFVPLARIPVDVATALAALAAVIAILASIALVGVRDWRCYAAALVWAPVWNAIDVANISGVLTLLVAVAWRYRATVWPLASAMGLAISIKLFLWPLLFWAALVRGVRAALLTVIVGTATTLAAWAAIGFAGMRDYPNLVATLADAQAARSYSLVGIADALGLGTMVGRTAALVVGGVLLVACVRFGRNGDERRSFTCAIAAAIMLSPIVWQHYLALLVLPIALARPRFSALWLVPIVLWVIPPEPQTDAYERFVPLLVAALLVGALLARPGRTHHASEPA